MRLTEKTIDRFIDIRTNPKTMLKDIFIRATLSKRGEVEFRLKKAESLLEFINYCGDERISDVSLSLS